MHPTRIFKSPEELEKAWLAYKESRLKEAEKWAEVQYVGKDGDRKEDNPILPLTMDGFEVYCFKNHGLVGQYFDNKDGYYGDFVTICKLIRQEIRDHQITGGLLGRFNPSITQRLNGLVEKQEIKATLEQPLYPDVSENDIGK